MKGKEDHGPGAEYPRWISEELIDETIRQFSPRKKDGPFTREEAIDLLIRLGVLLDVTGLLKVDLPDIDAEPASSELPAKSPPAPSETGQARSTTGSEGDVHSKTGKPTHVQVIHLLQ